MSSSAGLNGVGLGEVAEDEADDERHRREQPADRGDAERHAAEFLRPAGGSTTRAPTPCRASASIAAATASSEGSRSSSRTRRRPPGRRPLEAPGDRLEEASASTAATAVAPMDAEEAGVRVRAPSRRRGDERRERARLRTIEGAPTRGAASRPSAAPRTSTATACAPATAASPIVQRDLPRPVVVLGRPRRRPSRARTRPPTARSSPTRAAARAPGRAGRRPAARGGWRRERKVVVSRIRPARSSKSAKRSVPIARAAVRQSEATSVQRKSRARPPGSAVHGASVTLRAAPASAVPSAAGENYLRLARTRARRSRRRTRSTPAPPPARPTPSPRRAPGRRPRA